MPTFANRGKKNMAVIKDSDVELIEKYMAKNRITSLSQFALFANINPATLSSVCKRAKEMGETKTHRELYQRIQDQLNVICTAEDIWRYGVPKSEPREETDGSDD